MGRNRESNTYIFIVSILYMIMVGIISGAVHEGVHVLQYINLNESEVDEVCFFGVREYGEHTVNATANNHINTFMMKVGSIGGWTKINGEMNDEYIVGVNKDEAVAYFIQILFILLLMFPMQKVWRQVL